jgi:hypothetical protein
MSLRQMLGAPMLAELAATVDSELALVGSGGYEEGVV